MWCAENALTSTHVEKQLLLDAIHTETLGTWFKQASDNYSFIKSLEASQTIQIFIQILKSCSYRIKK